MTLFEFKILTDANIHADVVEFLKRQGCDAISVRDIGLSAASDKTILERAVSDDRVVVTHDRDFGKLVLLSGEPVVGIVYLRPGHIDSQFTIATVQSLMTRQLAVSAPFIVIAQRRNNYVQVRVRQL